ncbi:MAG: DUF427 domain-containing protein [Acidimicrobiia bacterium]|nr:DUF427 domain-containing protein [Acidimicrobiia bacterium]
MSERGRVRVEPSTKRVRAILGGEVVVDTTAPLLVWEKPYYPTYYLPERDVDVELLVDTGERDRSPSRGTSEVHDVKTSAASAPGAARWYREAEIEEISGHVRLDWDAMDAWFEEDEEVYVHPRDPYTRVDVLQSSRHVRIEVDGVTVADSRAPRFLFETGLPRRAYLPKTDVRLDLLTPSDTRTHCPYKGTAEYYSLDVEGETHEDVVWWYRHPTHESRAIAGYVCFYDERVDVYVDGQLQDRPESPFA